MTIKFIKLTEANLNAKTLLLNVNHIAVVFVGNSGKDTFIRMSYHCVNKDGELKNEYYFVKESVSEVEGLINECG